MTRYSFEDFDRRLLSMLPKGPRDVVEFAVLGAGWKLTITRHNSVILTSPVDERQTIRFAARGKGWTRSPANEQAMRRKIVKWGDPVRMSVTKIIGDQMAIDPASVDTSSGFSADVTIEGGTDDLGRPEPEEKVLAFAPNRDEDFPQSPPSVLDIRDRHDEVPSGNTVFGTSLRVRNGDAEQPAEEPTRYVVSQRPWLAHYGITTAGGKSYPSRSTDERHWSDGVTDYICRFPECDWSSESPKKVTTHFAAKHVRWGPLQRQEGAPTDTIVLDVDYTESQSSRSFNGRVYSPRKDRVEALAEILDKHVDDGSEEQAKQALIWIHDQQAGEGSTREPLTPEQVVERIRRIVDQGEYAAQREAMENKDVELASMAEAETVARERAAAAEARVVELEKHVRSLTDNLAALADLTAEFSKSAD